MWPFLTLSRLGRITLEFYRRRAFTTKMAVSTVLRRAFDKTVRTKPRGRRTRALCKLNGVEEVC